ncbi:MAG: FG-GAP repeat protein [Burkholderiales bacterium]
MSLGFGIKELRFSWKAVSGADYYRMLENPDGTSGYTQVGANLTALSVNHTIPVHRRLNASYIVEACNSAGCTGSAAQILGANLTQAIGYVKASLTGSYNYFGASVALSGDGNTMAVGVQNCDGTCARDTVYVYARSAGTWSQQATVTALNPGPDQFGHSLALSNDGNTLAVGAPNEDSSSTGIGSTPDERAPDAGAAYIFARSGGKWSQQAYVKASNTGAGDLFGSAVALSGDGTTLAVGAPNEDSSTTGVNAVPNELRSNAGAAYVFVLNGATWSQQAFVKAATTFLGVDDLFGRSVALSDNGNTLAVGGRVDTCDDGCMDNAVFLYTRSATIWSPQASVMASNHLDSDLFGYSVALSGDGNTLAVGAPYEDSSTVGVNTKPDELAIDSGAVYVFTRSGATWLEQVYVKASNTGAGDNFGISVALADDGNTLAVGAAFEDSSTTGIGSTPNEAAGDAGAVYVFTRSAGIWSQKAYVKASNTGAGDNFGISVTLSRDGNTLAVGAPYEDSGTNGIGSTPNELATNAGAVYLY